MAQRSPIFTVGYSKYGIDSFFSLLRDNGIHRVLDVRSTPYSYQREFDSKYLPGVLRSSGVEYHFKGDTLGGRPSDPSVYVNGQVDYFLLAETDKFQFALLDVINQANEGIVQVLVCVESDPSECHRSLLIAEQLYRSGIEVIHLLTNGQTETHIQMLDRLASEHGGMVDIGHELALQTQMREIAWRRT